MGMSNLKSGKYHKCIEYLKKWADSDLGNIYAINNLAYVYNISGQYNDTINIWEKRMV